MKLQILAIAVSILIAGPATAAPKFSDQFRVWVIAGHYMGHYESLALRRVESKDGPFWMAERRVRTTAGITGPTVKIERDWIDGRQCPAIQSAVDDIGRIAEQTRSTLIPPFHGARVHLGELQAAGSYTVSSDYEGPITHWWRKATAELNACPLSKMFASVDGEPLPLTLEDDPDEEPYRALGLDGWNNRLRLLGRTKVQASP